MTMFEKKNAVKTLHKNSLEKSDLPALSKKTFAHLNNIIFLPKASVERG
jgi:hypothetical protein